MKIAISGGTGFIGKHLTSYFLSKGHIEFILTRSEKTSSEKNLIDATAPNPVKMNLFGKTIGEVLQRPHWLPAPAFALKTLLGEMNILILEGQKVVPEKALKHHYKF